MSPIWDDPDEPIAAAYVRSSGVRARVRRRQPLLIAGTRHRRTACAALGGLRFRYADRADASSQPGDHLMIADLVQDRSSAEGQKLMPSTRADVAITPDRLRG